MLFSKNWGACNTNYQIAKDRSANILVCIVMQVYKQFDHYVKHLIDESICLLCN